MSSILRQDATSDRRRGQIVASPRARRAMRPRAIDPALVRGTGPGGRIVEADVLRAVTTSPQTAAALLGRIVGGLGRPFVLVRERPRS